MSHGSGSMLPQNDHQISKQPAGDQIGALFLCFGGICKGIEIQNFVLNNSRLNFLRCCQVFSKVAAPPCIPPARWKALVSEVQHYVMLHLPIQFPEHWPPTLEKRTRTSHPASACGVSYSWMLLLSPSPDLPLRTSS